MEPITGFGADPKGTFGAPKDTVPFGKGLARTLVTVPFEYNSRPSLPLNNSSPYCNTMVDSLVVNV